MHSKTQPDSARLAVAMAHADDDDDEDYSSSSQTLIIIWVLVLIIIFSNKYLSLVLNSFCMQIHLYMNGSRLGRD